MDKTIILGAGISGLAAGYSLRKKGIHFIILEKDSIYGGLCGNFTINGFRFDRFVHFSFSNNEKVNQLFECSCPDIIKHIPNPYNLYKGKWLKHPVQNNLFSLSEGEKEKVIDNFKNRPEIVDVHQIANYEEWLRLQFGNYFAEHFPMVYTRKYWMCESRDLETKWIGDRLYQPSIEEVIKGCETPDTPITYYAKEMHYPRLGGYRSFLKKLVERTEISYNTEVVEISSQKKNLTTKSGNVYQYSQLISSLPLPELLLMIKDVPENVRNAGNKLKCTSGYQISIGLRTKNIPPYLWWYIYDEDILPARVYSPSLKSPDNVPEGCSSLQLEVYCEKEKYSKEKLLAQSVDKLIALNIIKADDILFIDVRFEKYANVVFDHHIYESRKVVRDYLKSIGIETIGRFGEWDYLWSDQSLLSGLNVNAKKNNSYTK